MANRCCPRVDLAFLNPLIWIEYGFGYIRIRSPYTPYSIYLRGTIGLRVQQRVPRPPFTSPSSRLKGSHGDKRKPRKEVQCEKKLSVQVPAAAETQARLDDKSRTFEGQAEYIHNVLVQTRKLG